MSRKLSDKSLNGKKYWSLLKTLLNGKKAPCMPPIYHNSKFVSEIKAKCELFNPYFAGARPLSVIASCQQDLQLIPIPF